MKYIGIDPGVSGAIADFEPNSNELQIYDIPVIVTHTLRRDKTGKTRVSNKLITDPVGLVRLFAEITSSGDDCMRAVNNHLFIVPTCDAGGHFFMIKMQNGKPVTTTEFDYFLEQQKRIENLKLVVIGPLWPFADGYLAQNPMRSQGIWNALYRTCNETGATVLVTLRNRRGHIFSFEEAREAIRGYYELVDANRLEEQINDWCDNTVNDGGSLYNGNSD